MNRVRLLPCLVFCLIAPAWPAPAGAQPTADGADIFARNCAVCHGVDGKGTPRGPSLEFVSDASIVGFFTREGIGAMPSFADRLTDDEINAVADFVAISIATVSLTGGDISRGGSLYRNNCAGCHGTTGRGGAMVDVPNAPDLSTISATAVAGAVRSGPGSMPIYPQTFFSQQDLASIVLYVQLLQDPAHPGGYSLTYRGPVTEALATVAVVAVLALVSVWIERRGRG